MKYYKIIGVTAAIILFASCFMPWAYYPDLQKSFTGFFSEKNIYGRPGKVFTFFAALSIIFILINRIWAKRAVIFLQALNIGYLLKTYVIFTACYKGFCPTKQYGIYFLIFSCVLLLLISFFPDIKLKEEELSDNNNQT
ncbi:hypothetical protein EFY79_14420 [Hanamia caeni]|uniref:Uncharacterized protein n=1 Tax=Hanamia caeni TaxID=2294116 RepID=A0A3M9NAQ0_9BACT|nr:hypothetical protein [Hanamia caeni]RNI34869.1 hypothetical protein EFY79_14420 [Hanamia caeni]